MLKRIEKFVARVRSTAFVPVDIASIVFFRITFGLLMAWHVWTFFTEHRLVIQFLEPRLLFKYYGFAWVHPWPGDGLYIHKIAMGVFALFIAAGFIYRVSAALFLLSYLYFFLLDQARYQNHQYLICLFSLLLIVIPAHRAFSVDAMIRRKSHANAAPAWALWLLRGQMAVVYFYGGIAKINPDWLRGEPMRWVMARDLDFPIIGRFFTQEWAVYTMSYGALLLDLFIVPLLFWRRTRIAAFCVAAFFRGSRSPPRPYFSHRTGRAASFQSSTVAPHRESPTEQSSHPSEIKMSSLLSRSRIWRSNFLFHFILFFCRVEANGHLCSTVFAGE